LACLLRHPEIANRSCETCKQWQFNDRDGLTGKKGEIAERAGHKLRRIGPPPCKTCPKESPEKAHEHELNDRNYKTLELFYAARAMNCSNLSDDLKRDAILQRNFSIIDRIVRTYESERSLFAILPNTAPKTPLKK
jgi:hypothetical protein